MVVAVPNTLTDIINKVRRITKSPSVNMITDSQIMEYLNTYYLYDFPQELRLKNCLSNFSFSTIPFQDSYVLPTDTIITIEPPVYINGYQSYFTQSQDSFYRLYPRLAVQNTGPSGNGTVGPYTFTLQNFPVLPSQVVISLIDSTTNTSIAVATDNPPNPSVSSPPTYLGTLTGYGISTNPLTPSTINYVTGAVTLYFTAIVANTSNIIAQVVPYKPSRPAAMLFYNDILTLRPVPDACYLVEVEAFVNPVVAILKTASETNPPTLLTGSTPDSMLPSPPNAAIVPIGFQNLTDTAQLKQWWQLMAWGTSLKIFEDRGDLESISRFMPLYDQQKRLVLRRTLVEMANERCQTIYSDQTDGHQYNFFNQF
jgi:hypothetical protein